MSHLITADVLAQQGADCIFDCTFLLTDPDQGRLQYARGHIPGASYVDLNRDLIVSPDHRGRHPLPEHGIEACKRASARSTVRTS